MASVGPILLKYFDNPLKPLPDKRAKELLINTKKGIRSSKHQLFESCVRLATVIARGFHKKHFGNHLDFDDFLQEAYKTVWIKLPKWNTDYNLKTWMGFQIRHALSQLIRRNAGPIQLSDRFWRKVRKLEKLTLDYDSDLSKPEQLELLFKPYGDLGTVMDAKRANCTESIYSEFDDCAVKEIEHNYRIELGPTSYCFADVEKLLGICVKDKRRVELFARRYGLLNYRRHTLPELQKLYNMTYREAQYQIDLAVKEMHEYIHPKDRSRKCGHCGKIFEPSKNHPNAQTCSRQCNRKYFYVSKRKSMTCECCGQEFNGRKDQKFCSKQCNKRAAYRRKQGKPVSDKEYYESEARI